MRKLVITFTREGRKVRAPQDGHSNRVGEKGDHRGHDPKKVLTKLGQIWSGRIGKKGKTVPSWPILGVAGGHFVNGTPY